MMVRLKGNKTVGGPLVTIQTDSLRLHPYHLATVNLLGHDG